MYVVCENGRGQFCLRVESEQGREGLIWQDFFLFIVLLKVKNNAKGRVKVYHGKC